MSEGIDPKEFGEMCGYVKATHETVNKMEKNFEQYSKDTDDNFLTQALKIQALEQRNKNVKENWKNVGIVTASLGAIGGACRMIWSFVT